MPSDSGLKVSEKVVKPCDNKVDLLLSSFVIASTPRKSWGDQRQGLKWILGQERAREHRKVKGRRKYREGSRQLTGAKKGRRADTETERYQKKERKVLRDQKASGQRSPAAS